MLNSEIVAMAHTIKKDTPSVPVNTCIELARHRCNQIVDDSYFEAEVITDYPDIVEKTKELFNALKLRGAFE